MLADNGALAVDTGEFTGRSPKDRFIVEDDITRESIFWGDINIRFSSERFDELFDRVTCLPSLPNGKYLCTRDSYGGTALMKNIMLGVREIVVTETAYQNLFAHHLFRRPEVLNSSVNPEWSVVAAPGFRADPIKDGTRQHNFSIINFSKKIILIGGTGYAGEIKKGIFSVLNFILPHERNVLSMHCSANTGVKGDTAIFFGLSGTGKDYTLR